MAPLFRDRLPYEASRLLVFLTVFCCIPSLSIAAEGDETEAVPPASEQATTSIQSYVLPNIPKKRAQSLIEYMTLMERQEEIVQLSNSSEPGAASPSMDNDYYGLYLPDETGSPQGGVLILHDNQQHGHWPDIVAPLREYLPQHGWTTLTIELPDIPARLRIARETIATSPVPSNTSAESEAEKAIDTDPIATNQDGEAALTEEAADNAGTDEQGKPAGLQEESPTEESLEPALPKLAELPDLPNETITETEEPETPKVDPVKYYREQNQQRILEAIAYLKSKGQLNLVIIGYGIGAAWAIDYISQQEESEAESKGLTLVTIDAMPSRYSTDIMKQQLTNLKVPFLDIIQPNKAYALKLGKTRRAIMNRNKNEIYQQIITSNMTSYHEDESPTSRRIRGWLKTNAGGTLVKMN